MKLFVLHKNGEMWPIAHPYTYWADTRFDAHIDAMEDHLDVDGGSFGPDFSVEPFVPAAALRRLVSRCLLIRDMAINMRPDVDDGGVLLALDGFISETDNAEALLAALEADK